MLRRLTRIARWLAALALVAWAGWQLLPARRAGRRSIEYGVDAETGEPYGVRLTPLSPAETRAAWSRERDAFDAVPTAVP